MPREPALRNTCLGPRTSPPQRAFHPTDHVQQDSIAFGPRLVLNFFLFRSAFAQVAR
jgi:hypothetical protein